MVLRFCVCALACLACTKQIPAPAKLSVSGPSTADPTSASARLDSLAKRYWRTLLETVPVTLVFDGGAGGPLFATALGDHRFDSKLDDWSPAARRKLRDALSQLRSEAAVLDPGGLSEEEGITLAMLRLELAEELSVETCEGDTWVVDQMNGPQTQLPQTWMYYPLGTEQGVSDLIARYGQAERMFEQIVANLTRGMFQGKVSPRENVQRVIESLDALLDKDPVSSAFMPPVDRFAGIADATAARERVRIAVQSSVFPGLRAYRKFLATQLLPKARNDVGLWAVPGGDACYSALIAHHLGEKRSAQEIHATGMKVLASLESEPESIAKSAGQPDARKYREQLEHTPSEFKRTPEELLSWNEATLARATAALPPAFTGPPHGVQQAPAAAHRHPAHRGLSRGVERSRLLPAGARWRQGARGLLRQRLQGGDAAALQRRGALLPRDGSRTPPARLDRAAAFAAGFPPPARPDRLR